MENHRFLNAKGMRQAWFAFFSFLRVKRQDNMIELNSKMK